MTQDQPRPPRKDPIEQMIAAYVADYVKNNRAARVVASGLQVLGIGLRPVIDHITFRTLDVDKRAQTFLDLGFLHDTALGIIEYDNWWAKVYRKPGYPAIFIDQAYDGERGVKSLIPAWVNKFGDQVLHHIALQVDDIDQAIYFLEKQGIAFTGKVVGGRGTDLRQIFTAPEIRDGAAFSVLEMAERHHGYAGFLPPQADGLMESTRLK